MHEHHANEPTDHTATYITVCTAAKCKRVNLSMAVSRHQVQSSKGITTSGIYIFSLHVATEMERRRETESENEHERS